MTNKKKLIAFTGKARSGKDTAGAYLSMKMGFHRMAFADPLKAAMAATFGVSVVEFHDDELKDEVHPLWGMSRRYMLQQGADALREKFGQDLYIKRWMNSYIPLADQEHVVVTDVRSDREAEAILNLGGSVIYIERDSAQLAGAEAAHHTESGISSHLISHKIVNNGTKQDLWTLLARYLEQDDAA